MNELVQKGSSMTTITDPESLYLYNTENGEIEVKYTGRYSNRTNDITKIVSKYIEITPVDRSINWTKFVHQSQLSLIQTEE